MQSSIQHLHFLHPIFYILIQLFCFHWRHHMYSEMYPSLLWSGHTFACFSFPPSSVLPPAGPRRPASLPFLPGWKQPSSLRRVSGGQRWDQPPRSRLCFSSMPHQHKYILSEQGKHRNPFYSESCSKLTWKTQFLLRIICTKGLKFTGKITVFLN